MNPKCPTCSWKNGFSRSGRQRYRCKSCGKKFDERASTPYHWLHKTEKDVLTATVLYANYPLSNYQVGEILGLFGIKASARQIGCWPSGSGRPKRIFKRYKVRFSKVWHADEKFVPHDRVPPESGQRKWACQITVLDSRNNVVASYLAPERSTEAAKEALGRAKMAAGFSSDFMVSDDCLIYDRGLNVLGRRTVLLSNNRIERYHSKLAQDPLHAWCEEPRTGGPVLPDV